MAGGLVDGPSLESPSPSWDGVAEIVISTASDQGPLCLKVAIAVVVAGAHPRLVCGSLLQAGHRVGRAGGEGVAALDGVGVLVGMPLAVGLLPRDPVVVRRVAGSVPGDGQLSRVGAG